MVFLAPILGLVIWRVAIAQGLDGPRPRQLGAVLVGLLLLGAILFAFARHDALPPGRYVPAEVRGGVLVPGHAE